MALVKNRFGKARVRVMRINKTGTHHDVSELTVQVTLEGDFARAYTDADNSTSISTDTTKNIINVIARENVALGTEDFCQVLADKFLTTYPQVDSVFVRAAETKWDRLAFDGTPHPHAFVLDANGKPFVELTATRQAATLASGIDGFTFMKATQSGWENFVKDRYTTIKETHDRICATRMVARWAWSAVPANYASANKTILDTLIHEFATTYSPSVQNSLYRMGEAALAAVPEIAEISMACPNIHYLLMDLSAFGHDNENLVFLPTDEPHGQIECTVGRK